MCSLKEVWDLYLTTVKENAVSCPGLRAIGVKVIMAASGTSAISAVLSSLLIPY